MRISIMVLLGIVSASSIMAQLGPTVAGDNGGKTNMPTPAPPAAGEHVSRTNGPDSGATHEDKHILEPGDLLSFQIMEDKKPPINLLVTDSGELHVPYLGRVDVAGKTCRELAAHLKALLEKDYYYQATVIVGLDVMSKNKVERPEKVIGRVMIWGEVHSQIAVEIYAGHTLTVSEAILRAGGLTDSADKKNIKIIRNEEHGSARTLIVNLYEIMEKGQIEKDIPIKPNDYIIVGSRLIKF